MFGPSYNSDFTRWPARLYLTGFIFLCLLANRGLSQEGYQVVSVGFSGHHHFTTARLAENLSLDAKRGLERIKFWQKHQLYHESRMQEDLRNLIMFYQREGFIAVRISAMLDKDERKKKLSIQYRIVEGPPVIITGIDYVFLHEPADLDHLQKVLKKVRSKLESRLRIRFRDELIQNDLEKITTAFTNEGYAYATVKIRPDLGEDRTSVALTFEIDVGPVCHFGPVVLQNDSSRTGRLIKKQVSFRPGQIYRQERLQSTQRQIYGLGFFQFVTVKAMMDSSATNVLPVSIQARRAPKRTVKIGAGYSREDELRVFLDFRRLAFLGGARRLEVLAKHSALEPFRFDVKLYQAAFPHPRTSVTLNPFYIRQQEPSYSIDRVGAHLTLQQRFGLFTDGYINYTLEKNDLRVSATTRAVALDSSGIELYQKSSFTFGFAHDDSKPIFNPETGKFIGATLSLTGIGFRSDFHYIKLLVEGRKYWPVLDRFVMAVRAKVGSMRPIFNDPFTPIEDRFFIGGSSSLRGWEYASVGPKDWSGKPIGGNSLLEGSTEWRYPIFDPFSGTFFLDCGNVWSRVHGHRLADLRVDGGWGLRFRTPIGPIRLDLAWPLGEGRNPMQIHLSVGQAF